MKFRYNQKFDFEVLSGEHLESVHSQILEVQQQKMTTPQAQIDVPLHLILLDYFYKYLLFQTFPEVLSPSQNWNIYPEN